MSVALLSTSTWLCYTEIVLGLSLYGLAAWSYGVAVFTSPGSPSDVREDRSLPAKRDRRGKAGYAGLPSYSDEHGEPSDENAHMGSMTSVTAKSTGHPRFCKKCSHAKPDRAHHCSSCGRCVLKMDHHCPWLATCVGLHNYKPFLLFLIYTTVFCWLSFAVSLSWVWTEITDDTQMAEGLRVMNTILLAVLGGIIGLVLGGFTGWHCWLASTGSTTIESLEKTRYLAPVRRSMDKQIAAQEHTDRTYVDEEEGEASADENQPLASRLKVIHANALPGVLRAEEGDSSHPPSRNGSPLRHSPRQLQTPDAGSSPAHSSLRQSYASIEAARERDRYNAYLDEQASEGLPNAFDMGWRRNLIHIFGSSPLYWGLPVCNTSGDGWIWEVSPEWVEAREEVSKERERRGREQAVWDSQPSGVSEYLQGQKARENFKWTPGQGFVSKAAPPLVTPPRGPSRQHHTRSSSSEPEGNRDLQMLPLDRRKGVAKVEDGESSSSSDEETKRMYSHVGVQGHGGGGMVDWNDIPDDFLGGSRGRGRDKGGGRRKGD